MNREDILEMAAKLNDQFSLSIYKKVYGIDDIELSAKRKKHRANHDKKEEDA